LQDEEIPTEEKYEAIVKLWESDKNAQGHFSVDDFGKEWCNIYNLVYI